MIKGYFGDILYELEALLNYSIVFVEASENFEGYNCGNGTWNGILGNYNINITHIAQSLETFLSPYNMVSETLQGLVSTTLQKK